MGFPPQYLAPLAAGLAGAVAWDLWARRIPNAVSLAIGILGLGAQLANGGLRGVLAGMAAAAIVVAALYGFWVRGGLGGGDVKLAAAVAIWIGLADLPVYALATAVAGGVTAAVCGLLSRRQARLEIGANLTLAVLERRVPVVAPTGAGRVSVPYGLAIAAGAAVVWWRG